MKRILVTGSSGQIGSEIVPLLRGKYGVDNVVASDLRMESESQHNGPFETIDVREGEALEKVVDAYEIDTIFHLASLLSAMGEKNPDLAWSVNIEGLRNVLQLARTKQLRLFWPSTIAVFGSNTPRRATPQETFFDPQTIYGITKRSGELLCKYYHDKFNVDVRSLRYPGIISHKTRPGGGTTDYAVEVFHAAVEDHPYSCFVSADTRLPMMYIEDAVRAALELMHADPENLSVWTSYNLAAVSFSVQELADEIVRQTGKLEINYSPDHRQAIAKSWPEDIDDSVARSDWNWNHEYDLPRIVEEMISNIKRRNLKQST